MVNFGPIDFRAPSPIRCQVNSKKGSDVNVFIAVVIDKQKSLLMNCYQNITTFPMLTTAQVDVYFSMLQSEQSTFFSLACSLAMPVDKIRQG